MKCLAALDIINLLTSFFGAKLLHDTVEKVLVDTAACILLDDARGVRHLFKGFTDDLCLDETLVLRGLGAACCGTGLSDTVEERRLIPTHCGDTHANTGLQGATV